MAVQVTLSIDGVADTLDDLHQAMEYVRAQPGLDPDSLVCDETARTLHVTSLVFPWTPNPPGNA